MNQASYYIQLRKKIGHSPLIYPSVFACIKNTNDEILLVKKCHADMWGFPGGGVEPNETIHQALLREVQEETNITIEPKKLISIYSSPIYDMAYQNNDKIHPIMFLFACTIKSQKNYTERRN